MTFPLFNRVVVLTMSVALVAGVPVATVQRLNQQTLNAVNLFLAVAFFAIGCGGVWVSVFWKNRTAEQLAEEHAFPAANQPGIPEDALVYRFPNGTRSAAVHIDVAGRMIHFHHCHAPRRFLSSASEWFSCSVDDVQAAHDFRFRGESLTVVTSQGKAVIPHAGAGYAQLRDCIRELVPFTRPGFSADHPVMGLVYLGGVLIGIFAGVALVPDRADDTVLGVAVLAGSLLGPVGVYLLVRGGDRLLGIDTAQPLGYAVLGSGAGFSLSELLIPWFGWSLTPVLILVTAGAVAGFWFGVRKQLREREN